MPLDVDGALQVGRLHRATQKQKDLDDTEVNPDTEGEAWPWNCDILSFGELGPGVPLYFNFVKHVGKILAFCSFLYLGLGVYYFNSQRLTMDPDGQEPYPKIPGGDDMDEWANGLYLGCSKRGMLRLWNESINSKLLYRFENNSISLNALWFTAASRGPWQGGNNSCETLKLEVQVNNAYADAKGTYLMRGYHRDVPWFVKVRTQQNGPEDVLYADGDGDDKDAWVLARFTSSVAHQSGLAKSENKQMVDITVDRKELARSEADHAVFPTFAKWKDVSVSVHDNGLHRTRRDGKCDEYPGIEHIRCFDVALPCDDCEHSMLWSWAKAKAPKDCDIVLLSCVCCLLFSLSLPYLRYADAQRVEASEERTVSEDDYAVYFSKLPAHDLAALDEIELATFLQKVLDERYPSEQSQHRWARSAHHVVRVTFAFRLERTFTLLDQQHEAEQLFERTSVIVDDMTEWLELEAMVDTMGRNSVSESLAQRLKRRLHMTFKKMQIRRLEGRLAKWKLERKERMKKLAHAYSAMHVAGAIVIFETKTAARRALQVFGRREWSIMNLLQPVEHHERFAGSRLSAERPPEPSDIVWKSLGVSTIHVVFYRSLLLLMSLVALIIVTWLTYRLRVYAVKVRKTDGDSLFSKLFVIIASSLVVVADVAMREMLCRGAVYEKHRSWTGASAAAMWKLTVVAIVNGVLVVLGVHIVLDDISIACEKNWYLRGNLHDDAVVVSFLAMISTPIIQFVPHWNAPNLFKELVILHAPKRIAHMVMDPVKDPMTQEQLVDLLSGADFRIAYRYATILRTIFLTLTFAPIVPFVVVPGFAGLVMQYWADKFCLIRMARRPPFQEVGVHKHVLKIMPFTLLPIPLITVFLLRGTSFYDMWQWLSPCLIPHAVENPPWYRHAGVETRWARFFVVYTTVIIPLFFAILITFGKSGTVALLVRSVRFLIWCVRQTCAFLYWIIQTFLRLVGRGGNAGRPSSSYPLEEDDDDDDSMSYYIAQRFFPATYHKSNPIYAALPDVVNPDLLTQPEPVARKDIEESQSTWFAKQLRREDERRRLDIAWDKAGEESLHRKSTLSRRSISTRKSIKDHSILAVGTCGETALPLEFAFEKLLGMAAKDESGGSMVSSASMHSDGHEVKHVFNKALSQAARSEEHRVKGKHKTIASKRKSAEMHMFWRKAKVSLSTEDVGGQTPSQKRWAMVRLAYLSTPGSLRKRTGTSEVNDHGSQTPKSPKTTVEIEMTTCTSEQHFQVGRKEQNFQIGRDRKSRSELPVQIPEEIFSDGSQPKEKWAARGTVNDGSFNCEVPEEDVEAPDKQPTTSTASGRKSAVSFAKGRKSSVRFAPLPSSSTDDMPPMFSVESERQNTKSAPLLPPSWGE